MLKKVISAILFFFVLNLFPVTARAGVPDWLRSLANTPQKKYADDVNSVVLLDDEEITVKGQEYETKDKDTFETSLSTYEVFSDTKAKVIAIAGADVGTVVGFEYE